MAKRILVVDDDPDLREATEIMLSSAGYEVLQAASAAEAAKKLQSEPVDLMLLDVMMETDTEGFHLLYKLREDEKFRDLPIIILTCIEEKTGEVLEADKAGDFLPVQAYLRKPLEPDVLKAKVAELLE
ncbi:MAG: response regulator [Phycisphaerae bacterium]|nr:response regulator [Phycisphaerae bacterium]